MKSVYIQKFQARNLRNLESIDFSPSPSLNLFLGQNGQGKTNLLDAISIGASLKPLRAVKQSMDLVRFGQTQAQVRAQICGHDTFWVEVDIEAGGKKAKIAGKAARDAGQLNSQTVVVTFVPEDLQIVSGSAGHRRRLIDQIAVGLFDAYAPAYKRYEKVLLHRNQILKSNRVDRAQLAAFSQVFADAATPLLRLRARTLELIEPQFAATMSDISGGTFPVNVRYLPHGFEEKSILLMSDADVGVHLLHLLSLRTTEELARKLTLSGPQLDDLHIALKEHAARGTASRGQARAIVLALKIAQIQTVASKRQLAPILLLDDVVGELDPHNAERLLGTIERVGAQTFVTTTHLGALPMNWQKAKTWSLSQGAFE